MGGKIVCLVVAGSICLSLPARAADEAVKAEKPAAVKRSAPKKQRIEPARERAPAPAPAPAMAPAPAAGDAAPDAAERTVNPCHGDPVPSWCQ